MHQNVPSLLAQSELFDNLSEAQLKLVAAICDLKVLPKGYLLIEENDTTDDLFIIASGAVEILMNPTFVSYVPPDSTENHEPVVLTELRQGQVIGEVALVDQGIRSATVRVSQDDTQLLRIQRERLMYLCDTYPELGYKVMKNIAADLAFKIRNTDLTVRELQLMLYQSKKSSDG